MIVAAKVLDAMLQLRPDLVARLSHFTEEILSGEMTARDFCTAVRTQIGGTLLLDAMLMVQGQQPIIETSVARSTFEHCCSCSDSACVVPGCLAMREMLKVQSCPPKLSSDLQCNTCVKLLQPKATSGQTAANAREINPTMARKAAAHPGEMVVERPPPKPQPVAACTVLPSGTVAMPRPVKRVVAHLVASSPEQAAPQVPAAAGLLLLARSALGELSNSPHHSRSSSPQCVRKRPRVVRHNSRSAP